MMQSPDDLIGVRMTIAQAQGIFRALHDAKGYHMITLDVFKDDPAKVEQAKKGLEEVAGLIALMEEPHQSLDNQP